MLLDYPVSALQNHRQQFSPTNFENIQQCMKIINEDHSLHLWQQAQCQISVVSSTIHTIFVMRQLFHAANGFIMITMGFFVNFSLSCGYHNEQFHVLSANTFICYDYLHKSMPKCNKLYRCIQVF